MSGDMTRTPLRYGTEPGPNPVAAIEPAGRGIRFRVRWNPRARVSPRELGIVGAFVTLFVILSFSSPVFFTERNLLALLDQNAPVGIIAVGTTLCFVVGGFDLSIGAAFALAGMVAADLAGSINPYLALAIGVGTGVAVGTVNGLIVTVCRINPFIATLASSIIVGGLATLVRGGTNIFVTAPSFAYLGNNALWGVKYTVWVWLLFSLLCAWLLNRTVFGRFVFAVGGNEEAARLAGVRVLPVRTACYVVSGFAAALGGVIVASRASIGVASAGGFNLAFAVVAGVVIGGTSIGGGQGAIWRSVLGVMLLALIGNGFNLLGISPNYQSIFQGTLILLAVGADVWTRRRP